MKTTKLNLGGLRVHDPLSVPEIGKRVTKLKIPGKPPYDYQTVLAHSLEFFGGDQMAATTWINKYALRSEDKNGYIELSPKDMFHRLANQFAKIEGRFDKKNINGSSVNLSPYGQIRNKLDEETIFRLFDDFQYVIPQGSVMYGLGNNHVIASLSNCIVLPEIYDSYGGIYYADQQLAQLFKRRCGVGLDISSIRPSGMHVSNAAGTTTGSVSFMDRFSNTTREVAQNGRRGALMITIDIAHPDVEKFITIKQDLKKVTGANISIRLSDEFMNAVDNDTDYTLRWPIDSENPQYAKTVSAKDLWNLIIACAHNTAEPGLIFWDRQHNYSTSSIYPGFKNVSTNPCSEIAMQGGDSCRLIALNLFSFVRYPFTEKAVFDFDLFYKITYEAQRLMDDLVELELEAIERILAKIESDPEPDFIKAVEVQTWKTLYEAGRKGRRTGLGFTALADTIASLGYKFDSDQSITVVDSIMQTKLNAEFDSSIDMSIERGKFEGFNPETENQSEFIQMMEREFPELYSRMMQFGRRNISISTVAPTGTLSLVAQTSSGIEPVFMLSYKRRRKINDSDGNARVDYVDPSGDKWQEFPVYHPKLKLWMDTTGTSDVEKSPYWGSTAGEIDWRKRIEMQAIVQKYTTHSISSTINLPEDVSTETVGGIYIEAWKQGLKGITVYRDGSRSGVLISNEEKHQDYVKTTHAPKRPEILEAYVVRFFNGNEKWLAFVGVLGDRPYEIFTGPKEDSFESLPEWVEKGLIIKTKDANSKSRYDFRFTDKHGYNATLEGLSRSFNEEFWNYAKLLSGVLRHGMPIENVVDLVDNLNLEGEHINTWKIGVERALKRFIPDGTPTVSKDLCPNCNTELVHENGCVVCKGCNEYESKCG